MRAECTCRVQGMKNNCPTVPIRLRQTHRQQQVAVKSGCHTHSVYVCSLHSVAPSNSNAIFSFNKTATTTLVCSATYLLGLLAPPPMFQLINPRPAPAPWAPESEEGKKHTQRIENELLNLKLLKECRERDGSCSKRSCVHMCELY